MLLALAHGLAGDASTRKGIASTQNEAAIVGGKVGTQSRRSGLGSCASSIVSGCGAGVATSTAEGEDSAVAPGSSHDVHTGLAVVS